MHRPGESAQAELTRLLESADTPLIRGIVAFLSAQQHAIERIADSLAENTLATKETHRRFEEHAEQEEKFQTRIEAGFSVSRFVTGLATAAIISIAGALLALGTYVWDGHLTETNRESIEQRQLVERLTRLEQIVNSWTNKQ